MSRVTSSRVLETRLPADVRRRLVRLAARGAEAFRVHAKMLQESEPERAKRADLCRELCIGLEVAITDLYGAELRASSAETRFRSAEAELILARAKIKTLEDRLKATASFEEPTVMRAMTMHELEAIKVKDGQ